MLVILKLLWLPNRLYASEFFPVAVYFSNEGHVPQEVLYGFIPLKPPTKSHLDKPLSVRLYKAIRGHVRLRGAFQTSSPISLTVHRSQAVGISQVTSVIVQLGIFCFSKSCISLADALGKSASRRISSRPSRNLIA